MTEGFFEMQCQPLAFSLQDIYSENSFLKINRVVFLSLRVGSSCVLAG
jgi:hypothetical protein